MLNFIRICDLQRLAKMPNHFFFIRKIINLIWFILVRRTGQLQSQIIQVEWYLPLIIYFGIQEDIQVICKLKMYNNTFATIQNFRLGLMKCNHRMEKKINYFSKSDVGTDTSKSIGKPYSFLPIRFHFQRKNVYLIRID